MGGGLRLLEQTAWRAEEKQQPHGAEVPQEGRAAACLSGPSFSPMVAEAEEGPTLPCRLGKTGDSKGLGRIRGMGKGGRRGRETWKEVGLERWWKFLERKEEEGHSRGEAMATGTGWTWRPPGPRRDHGEGGCG